MSDITIHDQGSVVGFTPHSGKAWVWFEENVQSEGWQWMGTTLWVDHRFALPLLEGLMEADFEVSNA